MIDALLKASLRARLFVFLAAITVLLLGYSSYRDLTIEAFPDPTDTSVQIITIYPGQPAEEVERRVSIPLERALNGVPGTIHQRSISLFGLSVVTMTFEDGVDILDARQQIFEHMGEANLPKDANSEHGSARDADRRGLSLHARQQGLRSDDPAHAARLGRRARAAARARRRRRDRRTAASSKRFTSSRSPAKMAATRRGARRRVPSAVESVGERVRWSGRARRAGLRDSIRAARSRRSTEYHCTVAKADESAAAGGSAKARRARQARRTPIRDKNARSAERPVPVCAISATCASVSHTNVPVKLKDVASVVIGYAPRQGVVSRQDEPRHHAGHRADAQRREPVEGARGPSRRASTRSRTAVALGRARRCAASRRDDERVLRSHRARRHDARYGVSQPRRGRAARDDVSCSCSCCRCARRSSSRS